jgi:hypothetical protein
MDVENEAGGYRSVFWLRKPNTRGEAFWYSPVGGARGGGGGGATRADSGLPRRCRYRRASVRTPTLPTPCRATASFMAWDVLLAAWPGGAVAGMGLAAGCLLRLAKPGAVALALALAHAPALASPCAHPPPCWPAPCAGSPLRPSPTRRSAALCGARPRLRSLARPPLPTQVLARCAWEVPDQGTGGFLGEEMVGFRV